MKIKSKLILLLTAVMLCCITAAVFAACNNKGSCGVEEIPLPEQFGIVSAEGFTVDDTREVPLVYGDAPSSTEQINLSYKITVTPGCTWKLYAGFESSAEIASRTLSLKTGHNKACITVFQTDENFIKYELDIYRLDIKNYTFKNSGNVYDSGTVEEKSAIDAPQPPQRDGYTFSGWAVEGSLNIVQFPYVVTENVTFVAQYSLVNYTITYHLNGGKNSPSNPESYNIETGEVVFQPATHEDYTFIGWFGDELLTKRIYEIEFGAGNLNLYAAWADQGTEGLIYLQDGKGYSVTGYDGTSSEVVIPKKWNGLPVTSIGNGAFYGCQILESVTIPDSVTSICDDAFYDCVSLESVVIPDSVTKIDWYAFMNCSSLKSVTFGAESKLSVIGYSAFYNCESLKSVIIPDGVTSISYCAFYNCVSLESVIIPDSVTEIGNSAFFGCTGLVSVFFNNVDGWRVSQSSAEAEGTAVLSNVLANPLTAAKFLTITYCTYYWKCGV